MKNARTMTVTALTMTLGLALTGCAGQGGGDDELGPLDAYLEQSLWGDFDGENWAKTEMQRQNDVEKVVAECMTEQGFEYIPYEYTEEDFGFGSADDDADAEVEWNPVEDAKKTGYGISFMYDDSEEALDVEEDTWVDPNGDYLESLSESDMMAYQEALSGPMPADDADEEEWTNWEPSGCQGEAEETVGGGMDAGSEVYEDPEFTDLMTAIDNRYEEVESAPELVEVQREWASCMDDRGFGGYTNSTEPMEELNAEYAELMGWDDESGGEIIELDPETEQAFQKKEIETAVADYECQEQAGIDDAWTAADLKSQEKFVEAHRDQLDALVAKYGSQS